MLDLVIRRGSRSQILVVVYRRVPRVADLEVHQYPREPIPTEADLRPATPPGFELLLCVGDGSEMDRYTAWPSVAATIGHGIEEEPEGRGTTLLAVAAEKRTFQVCVEVAG